MVSSNSDRDDSDSEAKQGGVTRRRLIVSGAGVWTTASLAGCNYITDPGPPTTGGDGDGEGEDGGDGAGSDGGDSDEIDGGDTDGGDDGETDGDDGDGTAAPVPTPDTTVTNETTTTDDTTTPGATPTPTQTECANSREFAPGMEIALNVGVYDSDTGESLGADALDSVRVEFPDATVGPLELSWSGPHEQYLSDRWAGKIETDPDIESGTYRYEITIDGDGADAMERIVDQFTIR
jgi:hypothetical protein